MPPGNTTKDIHGQVRSVPGFEAPATLNCLQTKEYTIHWTLMQTIDFSDMLLRTAPLMRPDSKLRKQLITLFCLRRLLDGGDGADKASGRKAFEGEWR